jgi:hypothetical protein
VRERLTLGEIADEDGKKSSSEGTANGVDHYTMRPSSRGTSKTLEEFKRSKFENPKPDRYLLATPSNPSTGLYLHRSVEYPTGHNQATSQNSVIDILITQVQPIQVDVIRAILEHKMHAHGS